MLYQLAQILFLNWCADYQVIEWYSEYKTMLCWEQYFKKFSGEGIQYWELHLSLVYVTYCLKYLYLCCKTLGTELLKSWL